MLSCLETLGVVGGLIKENFDRIFFPSLACQESFGSIDQRIKDIKIESSGEFGPWSHLQPSIIWEYFSGKLQALGSTTRDQRREYKAKFVDLDVEFQRMKDRMEMLNMILDDMNVRRTNFDV